MGKGDKREASKDDADTKQELKRRLDVIEDPQNSRQPYSSTERKRSGSRNTASNRKQDRKRQHNSKARDITEREPRTRRSRAVKSHWYETEEQPADSHHYSKKRPSRSRRRSKDEVKVGSRFVDHDLFDTALDGIF